ATIALAGAEMEATLDGEAIPYWSPIEVEAGAVLRLGSVRGHGARTYLAVRGGLDVPEYLGSRATFTLGLFGGHGGRALKPGDVLRVADAEGAEPAAIPAEAIPTYTSEWEIGVVYGPHGAPDFFTPADVESFFATDWMVHYNSSRTGVRLLGPKPVWARKDGGEAGLHPSNIHDNAYAVGSVDFTGDMPIILGPDGPSLGGFVCPATVVAAELWKLGQLKPGDTVRFKNGDIPHFPTGAKPPTDAVLHRIASTPDRPEVAYRPCGDRALLVEYGPPVLDLRLRFRAHALMRWLEENPLPGVIDLTPGIRSLQVHFDGAKLPLDRVLDELIAAEAELPAITEMEVPTRIVHLPLSWDDPAIRLAVQKYAQGVRPDAPWCPSNIEFIRRINGLETVEQVKETIFSASYLVLGLGDVYLGAPVATPLEPRHRLVTTKYNPARTWTPENAVGIGGAYLCVYGMEGPGGYQLFGRTLQMWNRWRSTADFEPGKPWLLRFFDQIRFFPVSAEELLRQRRAFADGRMRLEIQEETFRLRDYLGFLEANRAEIAAFKARQQAAFEEERARWASAGTDVTTTVVDAGSNGAAAEIPPGCRAVLATVPGNVWKIAVKPGMR
ncbi:MAG: carboxyltransferase domain-containing protein, partial [Chloroflexi bacterium]|nr:carboxyltransferase domain-containing protein [Chloroflexota bacterium]